MSRNQHQSSQSRLGSIFRHVSPAPAAGEDADFERMPIIIGVARCTPRVVFDDAAMAAGNFPPSPVDYMETMARQAAADTGMQEDALLREINGIAYYDQPSSVFPNMARSVGDRLGVRDDAFCHGRAMGGDAVQAITNLMAERIAQGHEGVVLLGSAMTTETLRVVRKKYPDRRKAMLDAWRDDPGVGPPEMSGTEHDGPRAHPTPFHSEEEKRHGLDMPINIYPVIENQVA